jgi:phospholipid/cholesterol/gamma-HCH transport system substrate-binding protein
MRNPRINYLLVGGFVVGVVIALVVAGALLTGRTGATDSYYAIYDNVGGVNFGTRVLFEGYPVGQVERVAPVPENGRMHFHVEMSVIRNWPIPKDSIAEVSAAGLLAAVSINLRAGQSSEMLKPGDLIQGRGTANLMASVNDLASDIRNLTETDIKPVIAKISEVLTGVGQMVGTDGQAMSGDLRNLVNQLNQATPGVIKDIQSFSGRLNQSADRLDLLLSDKNLHTIEDIVENLNSATHNMNQLTAQLGETRATVDGMVKNADSMVNDMKQVVTSNKSDVEHAISDLRQSMETVSRHIDAISENMEDASRNMNEFSRQIRQNPGLLFGSKPPADPGRRN